jgi:hypothetical protein
LRNTTTGENVKIEEIMTEWDKDCKIDETELGSESTKIPQLHNKYLKIFMTERMRLLKIKSEFKKTRRLLLEYYLGELDQDELQQIGRDQFYKKLLKNEVDVYIDSDDMMTDITIRQAAQQEKVDYIESIIKSINTRGFQIKNAIEWNRFITG